MDAKGPILSLVLPTYQEADNIQEILRRLSQALEAIDYEIWVVDDDSPDNTGGLAQEFAKRNPRVRVLRRVTDRGLSSAVLEGFRRSTGAVLGVMDADLSHDEGLLPHLLKQVESGADLAVASRRLPGGGAEHWPWHRRLTSNVATWLARGTLGVRLSDPMSGYFLLSRGVYKRVADQTHPRGYKILLEIVARAGPLKIVELPYIFRDRKSGYSKLSGFVILNYLESLLDLGFGFRPLDGLRERYHRGRYAKVYPWLKSGRTLDLGCGRPCDSMPDGAFLKSVPGAVGLDMKSCVGSGPFVRGRLEALPFPGGSFDNVVAMEVLEHMDDLPGALREIERVLKPNGRFVMTVPDDNWAWDLIWSLWTRLVGRLWQDTHHVHLTRRAWQKILEERFVVLHRKRHWFFDLLFVLQKRALVVGAAVNPKQTGEQRG